MCASPTDHQNHRGTMHSGHYFSFCKKDDSWVLYNDDTVSVLKQGNFMTSEAFLLFYERVA